jgi:hypothetical protein
VFDSSIAEQNARSAALGRYVRWLLRRYQKLDLVEIADVPDPIELRQIFVPMRVAREDLREEAMGEGLEDIREEELPGEDAWDLLIREPFVTLSGLPGSGKTTLVQAIIYELCSEAPSRLRDGTRAVPVPLLLRHLPDLDQVKTLEQLWAIWWPRQEDQAAQDKMPLDRLRLQEKLFPGGASSEIPVLLLFDGIDEIGGPEIRQRLLNLAYEARQRGYRVLVTGRPTGYQGLADPKLANIPSFPKDWEEGPDRLPSLAPVHLLPFAWPQIAEFIDSWYGLRDEWERKKREGIARFLEHLANRFRPHMLSLARRPIFLTLMALVHCTQNEMPEGRPLLYRRILDLYLERQERHRQRQRTSDGGAMPHWPVAETRQVLAHLAWLSQTRGAEEERAWESERRRVVWSRRDVEETFRKQIEEGPGRFTTLAAEDAGRLVDYFLHPAGLLVPPTNDTVQFAHLSFQEYLCAWFLHERGKVADEGLQRYLERELFPALEKPGWDEVGILLLCIHADETSQEGHFKLLTWLDLSQAPQAALFISALTGRELSFTEAERLKWLPLAAACGLVHPNLSFGEALARIPEWKTQGLKLLKDMLESGDPEEEWNRLNAGSGADSLRGRWLDPKDDENWTVEAGAEEARAHALLRLLNGTGWVEGRGELDPIGDPDLEKRLVRLLSRSSGGDLLWLRLEDRLPTPTTAGFELDALLPHRGPLWEWAASQTPLDAWLLQGEGAEDVYFALFSQPVVLLTIFPGEANPVRARLALHLYQAIALLESTAEGRAFQEWQESLYRSLYRSRSLSQSQSRSLYQSLSQSRSLSQSLSQSQSRSLSRSLSQSRSLYRSQSQSRSRSQSQSQSLSLSLAASTKQLVDRVFASSADFPFLASVLRALSACGLRFAGLDWFEEQSENPDLTRLRGLRSGEPLPRRLGLLDNTGRPLPTQRREGWVALQEWLRDDEAILAFAFPEGLAADDREVLLADLEILRKQPWSPEKGVEALLKDWPKREKEWLITMEEAERKLREACEEILRKVEETHPGG